MAGIGTGPYKLKEFKPGVRSLAVRNENYWKPNRPYLDEIEYVGIGDESARVNALLTGEIDLTMAINPRSVDRIKGSAKHAIFETKAGLYTDLIMRRDSTPGSNPDFVLAMKHLFNREQMGSMKDAGSPYRELAPAEREYLQRIVDGLHGQFVRAVALGRVGRLTREEIEL